MRINTPWLFPRPEEPYVTSLQHWVLCLFVLYPIRRDTPDGKTEGDTRDWRKIMGYDEE